MKKLLNLLERIAGALEDINASLLDLKYMADNASADGIDVNVYTSSDRQNTVPYGKRKF